jgi:hypothetical protein
MSNPFAWFRQNSAREYSQTAGRRFDRCRGHEFCGVLTELRNNWGHAEKSSSVISAWRNRLASKTRWVPAVTAVSLLIGCGPSNSWESKYIIVKYRSDPIDIAAPYFEELSRGFSSVVDNAWYDSSNDYMIIVLKGVAYHYCNLGEATWEALNRASSRGSFYVRKIRGNFDCRLAPVPTYP